MKYYIENLVKYYKQSPKEVVEHMFATLGNGVDLDTRGYLRGNYQDEGLFDFPSPEPLNHIYPFSEDRKFQPFRKLAGCRDVGFKESVEYFLECVKLTPDSVKYIKEWKDNLDMVEDVLLNTPTIQDEFKITDMDNFLAKVENEKISAHTPVDPKYHPEVVPNSVKKVWMFDVQWSDCPASVEAEVRSSWSDYELGNDNHFWKASVDQELFEQYPHIYFWLKHKGVPEEETVLVHWWW